MSLESTGLRLATKNMNGSERSDEECGCEARCWCFRTRRRRASSLSRLNTPTGALIFLSTVAFLEGMIVNGLYNVSVTTLEKRFGLRSYETGLITSVLDIAGCIATLAAAYVGGAGHKPLWIGSGSLLMGVGSIVFSLPHFLAPKYSPTEVGSLNCLLLQTCEESRVRQYRGFFFLGFIFIGIGATPLYTLAISYLDENVKQTRSSMYSGIFYACALLGPGIGFLIGGYLLRFFTTMDKPPVGVTIETQAWVGNWWLSFLLVGILFVLLSLPLFMYPERIPGTAKHRENRAVEIQHSRESIAAQENEDFGKSLKDMPPATLILLKNPTIMTISFATALDSGLLIGLATFGPKYIESMYGLTASDAGFYFGAIAIVSASLAHLLSGFLIAKFELSVVQMLRMCIVVSIAAFGFYFVFLQRCENPDIVGAFLPYPATNSTLCTVSSCDCRIELYRPVCGSNNLSYLSFCDAGCEAVGKNEYANCSKIKAENEEQLPTASDGICVTDRCPNLGLHLVLMGVAVFLTFFTAQPMLQCSLRVVLFSQRSFCLGFQWMITRLLGSIPIPIVYGAVLDLSCVIWNEECDQCSSCHVYDNRSMSQYIASLCATLMGVSTLCLVAAAVTYKPPPAKEEITSEIAAVDIIV